MFDVVSALEDLVESFQSDEEMYFYIDLLCRSPRLGAFWNHAANTRFLIPVCILNHWNPCRGVVCFAIYFLLLLSR